MLKADIHTWAMTYSIYIVKSHCTLTEAAKFFGVPRSTLWSRLEQLSPEERADTKRIAYENKLRVVDENRACRKHGRRN